MMETISTIVSSAALTVAYACRMGAFHPTRDAMGLGVAHYLAFCAAVWAGFDSYQHGATTGQAAALTASLAWLAASYSAHNRPALLPIQQPDQ